MRREHRELGHELGAAVSTFATLFSGGELAGVGLQAAGLKHLWGIEYDSDIAGAAEMNGFSSIVVDVREVDYASLEAPYWLHASPVCKNASVAKSDGKEEAEDIETAQAVVRAIKVLNPIIVSIENVWGYRNFDAFKLILRGLVEQGYKADYWHLNAADYGVPQTRKRLILIARKDRYPQKPRATHHDPSGVEEGQLSLFAPSTQPWVGWYEAIEDLIDTLPESEFAPWQLERLPDNITTLLMNVKDSGSEWGKGYRALLELAPTMQASLTGGQLRAFLMMSNVSGYDRARIGQGDTLSNEPAKTVAAQPCGGMPRAFLVDTSGNMSREHTVKKESEPCPNGGAGWMRRPSTIPRAFVVDGQPNNYGESVTVRSGDEPFITTTSTQYKRPARAWLQQGRVVRMTPRALTRFQSVPDWYELPDKASLACTVIGNGVPSLLMQCIAESQLPAALRGAA